MTITIIERIQLINFKQYQKATIDFSTDKNKNVTIIYGVNGAGKSGVFQAINWCLYGFKDDKGNDVLPKDALILNKAAAEETKVGKTAEPTVTIHFKEGGKKYIATRSATFRISHSGPEIKDQKFAIDNVTKNAESETLNDDEAKRVVNLVLSPKVREYFLFDGEKIDKFSRIGQEDDIKDAIRQVIGLESLDLAKKLLENARGRYREEIGRGDDNQLKDIEDIIQSLEDEINDQEEAIKQARADIDIHSKNLQHVEDQLMKFAGKRALLQERKKKELDRSSYESKLEKYLKDEIKNRANFSSYMLAQGALSSSLEVIETFREKKQIPAEYSDTFLSDILHSKRCICMREIKPGSPEYEAVKSLLSKLPYSNEVQGNILDLLGKIKALQALTKVNFESFERDVRYVTELREQISVCQRRIDDISLDLQDFSETEFNKLEERRRSITTDRDGAQARKSSAETLQKERAEALREANDDLEQARVLDARSNRFKNRILLVNKCKEAIEKIKDTYAEDKRKDIDANCKKIFDKLVWKSAQFKNVHLTEDYQLVVLDRYNKLAKPDLSAGERQVLSLAFIVSMARSGGKEAPFILDTPFARLSGEPRENIARYLPDLTSQLVILVTDTELTPESEKMFLDRAGKTYSLIFDDETGITDIVTGKKLVRSKKSLMKN